MNITIIIKKLKQALSEKNQAGIFELINEIKTEDQLVEAELKAEMNC